MQPDTHSTKKINKKSHQTPYLKESNISGTSQEKKICNVPIKPIKKTGEKSHHTTQSTVGLQPCT